MILVLGMLLVVSLAVPPAHAQELIADAISREFSALNNTLTDPPRLDAVSRELSAFHAMPVPAISDASSREFSAWRGEAPPPVLDAVSREFSVYRPGCRSRESEQHSRHRVVAGDRYRNLPPRSAPPSSRGTIPEC